MKENKEPEEMAQYIFDQMYQVRDVLGNYPMCYDTAKECALIAVRTILIDCGAENWLGDEACDGKNYWKETELAMSNVQPFLATKNIDEK